ncbi:hypothetical protein DOY81_014071 [Sarcophaga bullata]|nr:hypothetical protein DOY81_014071 [Sarcophaga bullata]
MEDESYLHRFRSNFMGQMKNSRLKHKHCQDHQPESPTQRYKEQTLKAEQKIREFEANIQAKKRNLHQHRTSGGDADRLLYDSTANTQYGDEPCKHRGTTDNKYSLKQLHMNHKTSTSAMPSSVNSSSRKYQTTPAIDDCIDSRFLYENVSNLGDIGNGSEDSAKSQKSSKTVVSRKSSQDLRKMVTSQCKLHEVIDETLKQMCKPDTDPTTDDATCRLQDQQSANCPLNLSQCKRCSERIQTVQSQKDVTTEIGKGDFLDCRNTDTLTISVDDVVNSKVINPMIRKLQRMYLNNLKEEMSLMEDLERLPHKVNEVYKATIFKQKD